MDDNEQYKRLLNKILESAEFRNSSTYKKLLLYLMECHDKGEVPHETSIAMDLFDRDSSFNPAEETIVRVYIHELRKKLKIYYQTEGKKEKTQITIPKGGYELKLDHSEQIHSQTKKRVLLSAIIISVILNLFFIQKYIFIKDDPCEEICQSSLWSDFLNNDKPILIVFGDVYFFKEKDSNLNRERIVRDEHINSLKDLEDYKSIHPDPSIEISSFDRHTYLVEYSAYSLTNLIPLLDHTNKSYSIQLCSKLSVYDLNSYNIIFVGFLKTLGLLNVYFDKSVYEITSNYSFTYHAEDSDSMFSYSSASPTSYHADYGFIIKFLGPNDNKIILFTGTRLPGVMGVVNMATTIESLNNMESYFRQTYGSIPENFEVLYEVFGLNRQFIKSEILHIHKTDHLMENIWKEKKSDI